MKEGNKKKTTTSYIQLTSKQNNMAFALGFNDVEVKKTGSRTNVPNNLKATN